MLYPNIRKVVHDFLDDHEYVLLLKTVNAIDAQIADTLVQWGGDAERLYGETINHIVGAPEEFAGQVIDIVEDAITSYPGYDDADSPIIAGSEYDALADAIKKAVITYGAFVWKDIVPAIPTPCNGRELHALEIAMMAVTIACERIPMESAVKLVAHYQAGVSDYGTYLMTQEAAYAICELLEEQEGAPENGVGKLLALDEKAFLDAVAAKALSGMENVLTDYKEA